MKIAAVYCYPMVKTDLYRPMAGRFLETWRRFPPGRNDVILYLGTNGRMHFDDDIVPLRRYGIDFELFHHDNQGWDIGLFQAAAEQIQCDLLVCFGSPVHFYREGWMDRIVDSFCLHSPALFGAWGVPHRTNWHIRTTAFWMQPELLQAYPSRIVSSRQSRYGFEHGADSFTHFAERAGFNPIMVAWDGCHPKDRWPAVNPGPGNCLLFDQHNHL